MVTGATDGIGKKTAQRLSQQGHHVIVHGRDAHRVSATVDELKRTSPGPGLVDSSVFDLSTLNEVKQAALDLKKRYPKMDVLLNNAGTYQLQRNTSVDGFELTMAINHLGPTLLTLLLKPTLQEVPSARTIFVSSIAHTRGNLDGHDFNFEKKFGSYDAYATSKLANVITTRRLAHDWSREKISVYALHPGVITTKLLKIGFNTDGDTVERGSNTSVYLATSSLAENLNGEYFIDSKPAPVSAKAKIQDDADALWTWTLAALEPHLK